MIEEEKILKECLRRMKVLKLHDEGENTCVGDFRENKQPWKSEMAGILYWLDEEEQQAVKEFEEEHKGYKVYHCILNNTEFGKCLSMLYVNGKNEEEFKEDCEYFDNDMSEDYNNAHYIMSYVKNLDDEWSSEFGSIGIISVNGGVKRVG